MELLCRKYFFVKQSDPPPIFLVRGHFGRKEWGGGGGGVGLAVRVRMKGVFTLKCPLFRFVIIWLGVHQIAKRNHGLQKRPNYYHNGHAKRHDGLQKRPKCHHKRHVKKHHGLEKTIQSHHKGHAKSYHDLDYTT